MSSRLVNTPGGVQLRPWWHFFFFALALIVSYAPFELTGDWWLWRRHIIPPQRVLYVFCAYLILSHFRILTSCWARFGTWLLQEPALEGGSDKSRSGFIWLALGFAFLCGMLVFVERM